MALAAGMIFEVRPGSGSDNNGGGFKFGATGTDYSQQAGAQFTMTVLTTVHTTTTQINVSLVDATVSAAWVGNIFHITGGTATVGHYEITAVDVPNNRITVDRSAGTSAQTASGIMGGALASLGQMFSIGGANLVSGIQCHLKAGTQTLTTTTNNVSGGTINGQGNMYTVIGYNSARGDLNNAIGSANRPVIDVGSLTAATIVTSTSATLLIANVYLDGQSQSTITGFGNITGWNLTAFECTTGFSGSSSATTWANCSALTCGTGFVQSGAFPGVINSMAKGCTTTGFQVSRMVCCISIDNALANSAAGFGALVALDCTFHGSTGDAINQMTGPSLIVNNVFTENGGNGLDYSNATTNPTTSLNINNAFRNNSAGNYETTPPTAQVTGEITLTGDPYTTEASDDLSPNNTAGAGASLRNAGIDIYGQTDNRDVGAVQHADPAGGGGGLIISPGLNGGFRG